MHAAVDGIRKLASDDRQYMWGPARRMFAGPVMIGRFLSIQVSQICNVFEDGWQDKAMVELSELAVVELMNSGWPQYRPIATVADS